MLEKLNILNWTEETALAKINELVEAVNRLDMKICETREGIESHFHPGDFLPPV